MSAAQKTLLGALAACAVVLVALTLHGLRDDPSSARATARASASVASTTPAETPPWQANAETPGGPLPGTVPVSHVDPPRPDAAMPMPPATVIEPPNPALHRLPMDNVGGVDSDRPARAVPGLD